MNEKSLIKTLIKSLKTIKKVQKNIVSQREFQPTPQQYFLMGNTCITPGSVICITWQILYLFNDLQSIWEKYLKPL